MNTDASTWWFTQLAGAPRHLELPTDRPRPATPGLLDGRCPITAAADPPHRLAAFLALLCRLSNQEDFVVLCPVNGRLLPLRFNLAGDPTGRQLRQHVADTNAAALAHEVPAELQPIGSVAFADEPLPANLPPCDLALVNGGLRYRSDLFDAATVARMAGYFQRLLAASPEQPISAIPLLSEAERRQVLVEWNDNRLDYAADQTVPNLIEAQVARAPEAPALLAGSESLTFRAVNERANRLAHHLRQLGVGPDALVGVCLERKAPLPVALLAVLKAGGAYVPLDPAYPKDRTANILADAGVKLVLTQSNLLTNLPSTNAAVVTVDTLDLANLPATNPERVASPNSLAYVMFTSGSTGRPKGVAIEHRSVVAFIEWARRAFAADDLRAMLFSTSVCFDVSVLELFAGWGLGSQLVLVQSALHVRPELPVTVISAVPSALAELVRARLIPPTVTTIFAGGEFVPQPLVDQLYELPHLRHVYDLYGPTEATVYSTWTLRTRAGTATIGRPIANTQTYILDRHLGPVPIGVPGELFLAGNGLARGYWQRPDLTAEKFIANPFRPGARMYRTGDLARYRPDGQIEYLGRLDRQVKIRGFRVELGEIQTVLQRHPNISAVAVVARNGRPGELRLVAYAVAKSAPPPTPAALREFVGGKLPAYMIPSLFVFLDRLPLAPNGKVDVRALPAPAVERTAPPTPPRSPLETTLAELWGNVLRITPVGVDDNFFELGGTSLQLMQVHARLRDTLPQELPITTLFQFPTISALATRLAQPSATPPRARAARQRAAKQLGAPRT